MKPLFTLATLAFVILAVPVHGVRAQEAPQFMKQTFPEQGVTAAWEEFQAIMDPKGALDGRTKELIGLSIAAQIPCDYCVYYHTKAAKEHGATEAQVKEALAAAALVRQWSTMLNGLDYDTKAWRSQVDAMFGQK